MLLNVKLLGSSGLTCDVDADLTDSVEQLKEKIDKELKLGKQQKLLFKGKALQDGTLLSSYSLSEGAKLHLMVQKGDSTPTPSRESTPKVEPKSEKASLDELLMKALRPHFNNEGDTRKVVKAFKQNLQGKLACLSLDDIERVCARLKETDELAF